MPFGEWALKGILSKKRPIQQTIGTWFNGKRVVLDLKGTPLLENLDTNDELAAGLIVEIDQAERARERGKKNFSERGIKKCF